MRPMVYQVRSSGRGNDTACGTMSIKGIEMKSFLIGLVLLLSSCNPYSTRFDNKAIVDYCTRQAACEMELIDDADTYDIEDEAAYQQLRMELCVDDYHDMLEMAELFDCKSEAKAAYKCRAEYMPIQCNYDDDDEGWEDYYEDVEEVQEETCWKVASKADNCFDW